MVRRGHLGVICVDVSELLKEHERRKVEKRDNMVLYNGSYLITDPVPSLPQGSTGRRSLSSSLSRGSSVRSLSSKKDKTTGNGKRGGGGGKARRRGKGKKRKVKKSGDSYNDSFTNSQHMMPLIPGVVSTPSEGRIICSGGYSSTVKASRRTPPPSPPLSGARNAASSVSAWYGANEQQRRTPIGDSDEGLQLSRKTSSRDGMQRRSPTPTGRIKPSLPRPPSSSRRGGDEKEEESCTDVSEILDRGRRRLSRVMGTLQKRIWDGQQASSEVPLGGGGGGSSNMDNNSLHQANTSTVEGNYTERLSPEMVGTLGVTSVPRSPDSWGAPCTQRPRLVSRPKRSDAEFGVDTYIMHDTQGKERVMLLGVVSMLPRRLPRRVPSAKRRPTGTTLPPAFRRAARVVAAAQPTKRPKRF